MLARSDLATVDLNARLPRSENHFAIFPNSTLSFSPVAMFVREDAAVKAAVTLLPSPVLSSLLASDVQTSLEKADSALQSVTKSDVGLGNVDNVKQYSASNPPPYPVTSVNGQTGEVTVNVPTVPSTTNILKGDGSGGLVAATRGSDYIASGNIVKQTLVSTETTPTENYAINWVYG